MGIRVQTVLSAVTVLLAAGCTPDGAGERAEASHEANRSRGEAASIPPVYVDSTVQPLVEGRNTARENYLKRLEICQGSGLPTMALSPDELQKLGTTRLQQWLSPQKVAIRAEEWVLGTGPVEAREHCQFFLGSRGAHKYYDAEGVVTHFLDRDEVRHEPALADWHLRGTAVDAREDVNDASREARVRDFGSPVQRLVAGEPCEEWNLKVGKVCTWTGGRQWGFHANPPVMLTINHYSHLMNRIVLAQEPSFPAMNRVELREMRIGEPLDAAQMMPRPATAWPTRKPRNRGAGS